ncbi:MAG: putative DNA binding domain-containing protein [Bacteroidales bacterium]|nr:putative DNA binding domain-containing protein [Bacteroidales bacterium]
MDNRFIIDNLLMQDEGEQLEFKVHFDERNIAKQITAMLNGRGGTIIVGVNEEKSVVGIPPDLDVTKLLHSLMSKIRPSAPIDIQSVEYDAKRILLINVWEGAQKPYLCEGTIYQKVGSNGSIASDVAIYNMLQERKMSDYNWERMPVLDADIEDLDMSEVRKTLDDLYRLKGSRTQDEEEFLMNEGLLRNGNLTNACIVLYAKNPQRFIPQARIRLSVYSSDSPADLIDAQVFDACVFKTVEAIFQFLDMTYSKSVKVDGLYRTEKWNYPRIAVREGIMNAIVHRDYNAANGFMNILIFPNRMEIVCYGTPLINLTGNFMSAGYSVLRNPDIAHHCYYRQLIEMMGSGIPRMIQDCKTNSFDIPEFAVANDIVKVTFPNIKHLRERKDKVNDDWKYLFEGIVEGITELKRNDIKSKLVTILYVLHEHPGLRTNAIEERTKIPSKSIERYLGLLKKSGIVYYSGGKNTGGYYLSDQVLRE